MSQYFLPAPQVFLLYENFTGVVVRKACGDEQMKLLQRSAQTPVFNIRQLLGEQSLVHIIIQSYTMTRLGLLGLAPWVWGLLSEMGRWQLLWFISRCPPQATYTQGQGLCKVVGLQSVLELAWC